MYKIPANTLFLGKNLVFMPECHSTNTFALQLCQHPTSIAEGTVVITDHQTAGRGQRGNVWLAEPGLNLTFSIILKPAFLAVSDQFYLNIFTSLAIQDYLKERGCKDVAIKWPNDILIGEKKICGILIENQISGSRISHTVIGIGLNINQRTFAMDTATSLRLNIDREYELQDELGLLLSFIEARYLQIKQNHLAMLKVAYIDNLYKIGEKRRFLANDKYFEGIICGIDESGRLRVKINGEERSFGFKEISYVR